MDEQRGSRKDERQPGDPTEGVRIIGPDEAAEVMGRGDVAPRRTDDELRYGDRPPPPDGPRPALRFPLDASADPTRIERPPVDPAPDPVTGPVSLPHWTEPPTGEVPAVLINDDGPLLEEDDDDLEAWSSFATSTPRWRDADDDWSGDDGFVEGLANESGEHRVGALVDADAEPSHEEYFSFDDMEERVEERTADPVASDDIWASEDDWSASDASVATPEDQWTDEGQWSGQDYDDDQGGSGGGGGGYVPAGGGDRNLATAMVVGGGLALLAVVALKVGAWSTALLVLVIIALAAVEYFEVLRKVGWEAARFVGLVGCLALPLAVWWKGMGVFPLVTVLVVATVLSWYLVGAGGPDPRVLEGSGATLLGVLWIGGMGSAGTAMAAMPDGRGLLFAAILATVAYDVGGYFVGKGMGHHPLSHASPNKTVEGLFGGMVAALVVTVVVVGVLNFGPWDGPGAGLLLGLGAALAAPLGDLCQSVLKRDLGVKDMGTLLPGHGGVLDRFDAMLFVLPTVLWLALTFGNLA